MAAGKMRSLLAFQQRKLGDDGFGQTVNAGEFETVFTASAELIPRFGTEGVMAGRLAGVQPYTIKIRSHVAARAVDATWRATDVRSGVVYSIVGPPVNVSQKNDYIEILATVGTAGQ